MLIKLAATGGAAGPLYSDDVFSSYIYVGTGASNPIVNGVNLSAYGGLVWCKKRNAIYDHYLSDTARGTTNSLVTNSTNGNTGNTVASFNSTGFTVSTENATNESGTPYASWAFRKAPKFFDVVTYTGTDLNRDIAHSLGTIPGMIIIKSTSIISDWAVWHRYAGDTASGRAFLNTTAAFATDGTYFNPGSGHTSTTFNVGGNEDVNTNGASYVAYLFAHDAAADGIIQCGSFTTDGSGKATVNLGWEPQYLMVKSSGATGGWKIADTSRTFYSNDSFNTLVLYANATSADALDGLAKPTATGFIITGGLAVSTAHVYMAIRRPNKPPTTGTQVYNAIARTGTGAAATVTGVGFAPDLVALHSRSGTTGGRWEDRLRGATIELVPETTAAETTVAQSITAFSMNGFNLGTDGDWNTNAATYINHCFKRAPGVFDIVCFTGNNATQSLAHNLGVTPELMIVKARTGVENWFVYYGDNTKYLVLSASSAAATSSSAWGNTSPTATTFTVSTAFQALTCVAYLFASKAGISKVGTYTGNGTSQTINCGFSTGARFILIKRTDSTGDWFVWDTTRGIVAGNDPQIRFNATNAEITTDDSIDPDSTGFIVNQVSPTNANADTATYIYLAIA